MDVAVVAIVVFYQVLGAVVDARRSRSRTAQNCSIGIAAAGMVSTVAFAAAAAATSFTGALSMTAATEIVVFQIVNVFVFLFASGTVVVIGIIVAFVIVSKGVSAEDGAFVFVVFVVVAILLIDVVFVVFVAATTNEESSRRRRRRS